MKVAIDGGPLHSGDAVRGIGVHTRELIKELTKFQNENFKIDVVDFKNSDLGQYDIVHYPYFHPHFLTLPFKKPASKVILTIHDLVRLIYPRYYPPGIRGRVNFFLQKYNLRNVDAIITISETSKKDIVRLLDFPGEKIFVTHLAPQSKAGGEKRVNSLKRDLSEKFVLYVGDVNYNKNLLNLAKACKLAKLKLVMVGKQSVIEEVDNNIENKPWQEFLRLYKNDKDIIRLGFIDDFDEVFRKASVYCQPSLYEGFGLPILEAFERGVPVVASKTQALVEVGESACFFVDPKSPESIGQGLKKVIENKKLASELVRKGRERLKSFSWKKTAKETLGAYKSLISN